MSFWGCPSASPCRLHRSKKVHKAQEDGAANLGTGTLRRCVFVVLPALVPGLAAAGIMNVLLSFGEVTVTSVLRTARLTTLPVRIYAEASFSLEPTVDAVATMVILATVLCLVVLGRLVRLDPLHAR